MIEPSFSLPDRLPRHVGLIMDGNGRWAQARGLSRQEGHARGIEAVRRAVQTALACSLEVLTLYTLSLENWRRPKEEIDLLMDLIRFFIETDLPRLKQQNIRLRIIGEKTGLPEDILTHLQKAEQETKDNSGMTLVTAFNYGGRQEIVSAVRVLARDLLTGSVDPCDITEERLASYLGTTGLPDPDLIIRTSGELRLSNFLVWQSAYSEFVSLPQAWPDFDQAAFLEALFIYARRCRRFGGIGPISDT